MRNLHVCGPLFPRILTITRVLDGGFKLHRWLIKIQTFIRVNDTCKPNSLTHRYYVAPEDGIMPKHVGWNKILELGTWMFDKIELLVHDTMECTLK
jgi:hypothetical protein